MNLILIDIHSTDPFRRYDKLSESIKALGDGCYIFDFSWIIQTQSDPRKVYEFLTEQHLIHPDDQLMIAPLSGPWLAYNCPSSSGCFDLSS